LGHHRPSVLERLSELHLSIYVPACVADEKTPSARTASSRASGLSNHEEASTDLAHFP
jgi:hypothetical protein